MQGQAYAAVSGRLDYRRSGGRTDKGQGDHTRPSYMDSVFFHLHYNTLFQVPSENPRINGLQNDHHKG